jgi:hypothetical protein
VGGDRSEHHDGIHSVFDPWDTIDTSRHHPTVVQELDYNLVALSTIGPHDRALRACGGGPVDTTKVIIWLIVPELIEVGATAAATRRADPDFKDPRFLYPEFGFVARPEGRIHAKRRRHLPCALASPEPQGAVDAKRDVGDVERASPGGFDPGRRLSSTTRRQACLKAAIVSAQRGSQLVRYRDVDRSPQRIVDHPFDSGSLPNGHGPRETPSNTHAVG